MAKKTANGEDRVGGSQATTASVSPTAWTKNLLSSQKKSVKGRSYRFSNEDESIYKLLSIVLMAPFVLFAVVVLFDTETYSQSSILKHPTNTMTADPQFHSYLFAQARSTATGGYPNSMENSFENKPTLCSDGYTYGYSDWTALQSAITEANELSSYEISLGIGMEEPWYSPEDYSNTHGGAIPPLTDHYADTDLKHFVICPGITLRGRNKKGGIYINTEDILIECEACMINIGETHFSFGPNAKGVVVRGITFMGARTSSLTFHNHGAEVTFEDCIWMGNAGLGSAGAVADLNSTSSVSFFRCEISDSKQLPRAVGYGNSALSSSLTIRN